jgi:hypothetical protein
MCQRTEIEFMEPLETTGEFFQKEIKKAGEGIANMAQNYQTMQQAQQRAGQRVQSALKAAIGLPEQIDRLTGEIGKLFDVASAQKLLAEDAVKQSENLSRQTDGLIGHIGALIRIADEQKSYAAKLERQTNKLICLTWALVIFSIALLVVSLKPTKIMLKENSEAHVQQIQAGQHQQDVGTNR